MCSGVCPKTDKSRVVEFDKLAICKKSERFESLRLANLIENISQQFFSSFPLTSFMYSLIILARRTRSLGLRPRSPSMHWSPTFSATVPVCCKAYSRRVQRNSP